MLLRTLEQEEICLTFPVGIGIFIAYMIKNLNLLNVQTLKRHKSTPYDQNSDGLICKHWKSRIHSIVHFRI